MEVTKMELKIGDIVELVTELDDSVIETGSHMEVVDITGNDCWVYYGAYQILPVPKTVLKKVFR